MEEKKIKKQKILIVDDSEINRSILNDMLCDEFDIIEAENGKDAVDTLHRYGLKISLVLLDIVMPVMDGFEVLAMMNKYHWIDDIPVIMLSAENSSYIERAYDLGATDFITRPFDALIVHRRVINTIILYAKQKKLIGLVADQIYEKEKASNLMIAILSHIVEFRNGESGLHVLHITAMTEILLKQLMQKTDKYDLTNADISLISTAAALHDIGKISIPEEILNKPGRLTKEEFEIMKTHSAVGAEMLTQLPFYQQEPLIKVSYEICRWHHERYDGRGYPDGLKGEEIPISAQIVFLADVYDALTSERVYKAAFSHEKALKMILNGECGTFSSLLLECLEEAAEDIQNELKKDSFGHSGQNTQKETRDIAMELLNHEDLLPSDRTFGLLEHERTKYQFYASMSKEILFEYTDNPPVLTVAEWGAKMLGVDEYIVDPWRDEKIYSFIRPEDFHKLKALVRQTTPESPEIQMECPLVVNGESRWHKVICRSTWSLAESPEYIGMIGKAIDIHEDRMRMMNLEYMASYDSLTGILNQNSAKNLIEKKLREEPEKKYILAIFDLDCFREANDCFGHRFGDQLLIHAANLVKQNMQNQNVFARVGGDEFLLFMEYEDDFEEVLQKLLHIFSRDYEGFSLSISIGAALTERAGYDYNILFQCADQALYMGKRKGRGGCCLYEEMTKQAKKPTVISPIEDNR